MKHWEATNASNKSLQIYHMVHKSIYFLKIHKLTNSSIKCILVYTVRFIKELVIHDFFLFFCCCKKIWHLLCLLIVWFVSWDLLELDFLWQKKQNSSQNCIFFVPYGTKHLLVWQFVIFFFISFWDLWDTQYIKSPPPFLSSKLLFLSIWFFNSFLFILIFKKYI